MAKFCTNCGKEIPDGVAFCTECGTKAPAEEATSVVTPEPVVEQPKPNVPICVNCGAALKEGVGFCTECGTPRDAGNKPPVVEQAPPVTPPPVVPPPQPTYTPPPTQTAVTPPIVKENFDKVVSTGAFFGLEILFMLPVIGWIICLIMAFTPKNRNIKNFARAKLIWVIISIMLCVAVYFLFAWLGNLLMEAINEATGGNYSGWGDLFEGLQDFQNGDFSNLPLE